MTTFLIFILLAAALLYLFAVAPDKSADMLLFRKWHYAHRGLHNLADGIPENSLPAFERAVENGYGIELDVHLASDGEPVVLHDDDLRRACGEDVPVSALISEELGKYKLFGTENRIPLFTDVLGVVSGKVPLIVEIKSCKDYRRLCEAVSDILSAYDGPYCIESFDPRIVRWFRLNRPGIIRGQLSADMFRGADKLSFFSKLAITCLLTNFLSRPQFISYLHADSRNPSFLACRKLFGANTVAWTIRSADEMKESAALFDMFIFEGFRP